eukprot:1969155-Karenia_brevis.AAC.1
MSAELVSGSETCMSSPAIHSNSCCMAKTRACAIVSTRGNPWPCGLPSGCVPKKCCTTVSNSTWLNGMPDVAVGGGPTPMIVLVCDADLPVLSWDGAPPPDPPACG